MLSHEFHGVSNHCQLHCFITSLLRLTSKTTSMSSIIALFVNLLFSIHHRIPHTKGQQYRKGYCVMVSSWSSDVQTTGHCAIVVHMHTVAHNNTLKWLHICGNGMVTSHSGRLQGMFLWLYIKAQKLIWWVQTLSQQHILEAELRIHQCQRGLFVSRCEVHNR